MNIMDAEYFRMQFKKRYHRYPVMSDNEIEEIIADQRWSSVISKLCVMYFRSKRNAFAIDMARISYGKY